MVEPRAMSYGVYMLQLIRFAIAYSHVDDFIEQNKILIEKTSKTVLSVL